MLIDNQVLEAGYRPESEQLVEAAFADDESSDIEDLDVSPSMLRILGVS